MREQPQSLLRALIAVIEVVPLRESERSRPTNVGSNPTTGQAA